MILKASLMSDINKYLSLIQCYIKNQNSIGCFDINKYCEDVFRDLLNIIFDLKLTNLNQIQVNFPAVDLGDYNKRISFQVTSSNDSNKIKHTVDKFIKNKLYDYFDKLVIFILGDKKSYRISIDTLGKFNFNIFNDVMSINDLPSIIYNFPEDKIKLILNYLKSTIIFCSTNIEMDKKLFDDFNNDIREFIKFFNDNYMTICVTPEKLIYGIDSTVKDWMLPDKMFSLDILNEKKQIIIECLSKLSCYLSNPIYFQEHNLEGHIMPLKDPKRINYNKMKNDTYNISKKLIKAYNDLCSIIHKN